MPKFIIKKILPATTTVEFTIEAASADSAIALAMMSHNHDLSSLIKDEVTTHKTHYEDMGVDCISIKECK
jgi:hypothetical protein